MSIMMLPTRDGYGNGLLELGAANPDVLVLDADLAKSTRSDWFAAKYPERFFDIGISEQDMIGTPAPIVPNLFQTRGTCQKLCQSVPRFFLLYKFSPQNWQ